MVTPRLLAQLSWLFECEAVALAGGHGARRPPTDDELFEADRLFVVAGELANRASEAGQSTGRMSAFAEER